MKMTTLTPEFVDDIPETLTPGRIYVSKKFKLAMHQCACGCGGEVTTRLGPGGWTLIEGAGEISLDPSIGPSTQRCKSHYFLRGNRVQWLPAMTTAQIAAVQRKDAGIRRDAFKVAQGPWYQRLWRWLDRIFSR